MDHDVVVLGAGLAGLSAARDLHLKGVDVAILEARDRIGGRVRQTKLDDGRTMQLGGELVGTVHTSYIGLVGELGLELRDSYISEPGGTVWDWDGQVSCGDPAPWMTAAEVGDVSRVEAEFVKLARTVNPDDPWSHPHAAALDALSFEGWLRSVEAKPAVVTYFRAAKAALAADAPIRTSMLAELRKMSVAGDDLQAYYDVDQWTGSTVVSGSASVALTMGEILADRIALRCVVEAIDVAPDGVVITLAGGRTVTANSVICAIPVAPLRSIRITGLTRSRLNALRRIRNSLSAKVVAAYDTSFWREQGQNGSSFSDGILGGTWVQGDGIISSLVAPEQLAWYMAGDQSAREREIHRALSRMFGPQAAEPVALATVEWSANKFTLGYMAHYSPGDLTAIGPLHAASEPPFYVAGSDYWVAGYMEGAVRTGRAAAREILERG